MKRFYKLVSIGKSKDGFNILLDGRPVKNASGLPLLCLNEAIANHVMQEWAQQVDEIVPDDMPFMQIENTRIERVSSERKVMTKSLLKYLDTDLICYIVDEPKQLAKMQNEHWSKWRTWFEKKFGTTLDVTNGLAALTQKPEAHRAVQEFVKNLDDAKFTILQIIVPLSGSLILGMAFVDGEASPQDVFAACTIEETHKDELYNAEKYGKDPLLEKKQKAAMRDLTASHEYLLCL